MNKFASRGCFEVSSFHRKRRSRIPSYPFVDFVNHHKTPVMPRNDFLKALMLKSVKCVCVNIDFCCLENC
jgi:hypothetical protein